MAPCQWLILTLCTMITTVANATEYYINCKWANEGCHHDKQCCSGRCVQEHPGTNPRCTAMEVGGTCLFHYHCGQKMQCGQKYKCCAKNWDTCSKDEDCCQKYHKCMETKGFVYKKCRVQTHVYLPKAGSNPVNSFLVLPVAIMTLVQVNLT